MNQDILALAKRVSETDANARVMEVSYRSALAHHEDAKKALSEALWLRQEAESVALDLGAGKIMICVFDGEENYEFSIVRTFC
jgi:hypothetical protein